MYAGRLRELSACVQKGRMSVYKLPLTEYSRNEKDRSRVLTFGTHDPAKTEKVIITVGATGSGKSTLIDAFVNHMFGVDYSDAFRFKIVNVTEEEKANIGNDAVSQTRWLTAYKIFTDHGIPLY